MTLASSDVQELLRVGLAYYAKCTDLALAANGASIPESMRRDLLALVERSAAQVLRHLKHLADSYDADDGPPPSSPAGAY